VILRLLTKFGYLAITLLLIGGGMGAPVPEELLQLTTGYLSRRGPLSFVPALIAVYCGIVVGDVLFFQLARSQGPRLLSWRPVARVLTPERRLALERHFARHAFLTIVVARHMSGLRLAAYALAAVHGVRRRTFVLADALSALLSVPLVVSLGYLFAAHVEELRRRIEHVEYGLVVVALVAAVIVIVVKRRRGERLVTRDGEGAMLPRRSAQP
jgi:membrane protein DedA with SNARE-associated domain